MNEAYEYEISLYGKVYHTFAVSDSKAKNNISFRIFGRYNHEAIREMIVMQKLSLLEKDIYDTLNYLDAYKHEKQMMPFN